jgi:predicted permease
MPSIRELLRRIWFLLNRRRMEAELEQEMQAHREMLAEAQGVRFGNSLQLREQSRDIWGWNGLDTFLQDLRTVRRTLKPGFAAAAGLILSLGIGLNLTLFQIVHVALLTPVPVSNPETAVQFYSFSKTSRTNGVHWQAAETVRQNNSVLSAVLMQTGPRDMFYGPSDATIPVKINFVTPNWFDEFGYGTAVAGQVLHAAGEQDTDSAPTIVLSHAFWRSHFNSDPQIAGRKILLNNRPAIVAGVAAPGMPDMHMSNLDAWIAYPQLDYFFPGTDHRTMTIEMFGRLRPGVSIDAARDALRAPMAEASRRLQTTESPAADTWLEPVSAVSRFELRRQDEEVLVALGLGTSLALLVLLVACANVGNLILARSVGRIRELGVRAALGASRWRIMRLLLAECLVLACLGAAGGIALAAWSATIFAKIIDMPAYLDFTPDAAMIAAALCAALVSMLACGLLPALRISRQDLSIAMKDGGNQASAGLERTRLRKWLVTAQVAGCTMLLIVAGLMIRSLQHVLHADKGFDFEQVATLDPSLSSYGMKSEAARVWWDEVRRSITAHPEVESASLVLTAPLGGSLSQSSYRDAPALQIVNFDVEPGFMKLMRIPILAGRDLSPSDDPRTTVVISRRVAEEMYGSLDVIGQAFPKTAKAKDARTIVGVAADAHMLKVTANDIGEIYKPLRTDMYAEFKLIVRARSDAERLLGPLRQSARLADDRILAQVSLMRSDFETKLRGPRLASTISTLMGLLTLALACLGIYGVVAFSTAVRIKEIGIRLAIGAPRRSVVGLLVRQQGWPLFLGATLGIAASIPAGVVFQSAPLYLTPEPLVQAAAMLVLALTGGAAALLPALRALRLDPLSALRQD